MSVYEIVSRYCDVTKANEAFSTLKMPFYCNSSLNPAGVNRQRREGV